MDPEVLSDLQISEAIADLPSELADTAIYLMRSSVMLECDLETGILTKMRLNDRRYQELG